MLRDLHHIARTCYVVFPRGFYWGLYCICCIRPHLMTSKEPISLIAYHFYADDSQLYCSFKPQDQVTSVRAIESCLNEIDAWMLTNMLKLNKKKKNRTPSDYLGAEIKHQCSDSKMRGFGKITVF